eukprot:5217070-Alexandrium_andersonii.AAC.1
MPSAINNARHAVQSAPTDFSSLCSATLVETKENISQVAANQSLATPGSTQPPHHRSAYPTDPADEILVGVQPVFAR